MLGQRIVTAVVLLALLIPALLSASSWPFTVLTATFIAAAGWEWGRLNGWYGPLALALGVALAALCALTWGLGLPGHAAHGLWWAVSALWVVGGAWCLFAGPPGWKRSPAWLRRSLGLLLLWVAWCALVAAWSRGLSFLMSVFVTVWVADVAAYFGGRALGGPRLAPHISPGKTWAGAFSGVAAVLAVGAVWLQASVTWEGLQGSLFAELASRFGLVIGFSCLALVTAMSVVGDLFESLVKRAAGV
jgi:phosphatidate cytidylyltransferase